MAAGVGGTAGKGQGPARDSASPARSTAFAGPPGRPAWWSWCSGAGSRGRGVLCCPGCCAVQGDEWHRCSLRQKTLSGRDRRVARGRGRREDRVGPGLGGGWWAHGRPARGTAARCWVSPGRHVCTPRSWECEPVREWGLCRSDQVMDLRLGPKSSGQCPDRKGEGDSRRGDAQGEVTLLRAQQHQGLLGTNRQTCEGPGRAPLGPPAGTPAPGPWPSAQCFQTADFWPPER